MTYRKLRLILWSLLYGVLPTVNRRNESLLCCNHVTCKQKATSLLPSSVILFVRSLNKIKFLLPIVFSLKLNNYKEYTFCLFYINHWKIYLYPWNIYCVTRWRRRYGRTVSRDKEVALEINKSICSNILNKVSSNFRSKHMSVHRQWMQRTISAELRPDEYWFKARSQDTTIEQCCRKVKCVISISNF